MNAETANNGLLTTAKFKDFHTFPDGHPLVHLNEATLKDALAEIMQGVEFTRVFATHVRIKLEPILSIDFESVNKNEIVGVVMDIGKTLMQDKLTPAFLKSNDDGGNMLRTIDQKFAAAKMPLNLEGIFSMTADQRGFMLEFIRFWGMYYDNLPQQKLNQK